MTFTTTTSKLTTCGRRYSLCCPFTMTMVYVMLEDRCSTACCPQHQQILDSHLCRWRNCWVDGTVPPLFSIIVATLTTADFCRPFKISTLVPECACSNHHFADLNPYRFRSRRPPGRGRIALKAKRSYGLATEQVFVRR